MPDASTEPEKLFQRPIEYIIFERIRNSPTSAIVSILSETLFKHRQEVDQTIPPFLSILEEGRTLIPSRSENR